MFDVSIGLPEVEMRTGKPITGVHNVKVAQLVSSHV